MMLNISHITYNITSTLNIGVSRAGSGILLIIIKGRVLLEVWLRSQIIKEYTAEAIIEVLWNAREILNNEYDSYTIKVRSSIILIRDL
jgi:hypothetical protein